MKRAVYDKQFKMAAVKLAQGTNQSVTQTAIDLGISGAVCVDGSTNMMRIWRKCVSRHGNALFNSTYEIKKLQKQIDDLKMENEILKNSRPLESKECVRFQFLKENQKKYNIQKACKILKISRSGYYDYLKRRKSKRAIENEVLSEMIEDIFHENKGRKWCKRRIQKVLEQKNIKVNPKRVSRLMSEHGLIAKGTRNSIGIRQTKCL